MSMKKQMLVIMSVCIVIVTSFFGCVQQKREVPMTTPTKLEAIEEKVNALLNKYEEPNKKGNYTPEIRGINYFHEPLGALRKNKTEIRFDFAMMRAIGANAVRLWGYDSSVFKYVDLAHKEGLQVWLTYQPFFAFPDMSFEEYKKGLAKFAREAEKHNVQVLFVGNELEIWGGESFKESIKNRGMSEIVDELAKIARENYNGKITYATYKWWNVTEINWENLDIISVNAYIDGASEKDYFLALENIKKLGKSVAVSEVGSLTITNAEKAGGDYTYVMKHEVEVNETKQAELIDKQLKLIYKAEIPYVFVFCWDEPAHSEEYDKNKYGFGIWNHIKKQPKKSFFIVWSYYKEG